MTHLEKDDKVKRVTKAAGPGQRHVKRGVVAKYVGRSMHAHAVVVIDWEDGTRSTEWDDSVTKDDE